MKFVTPLTRIRGMGSAHEGASHWLGQRVSALAMVPLSLWFFSNLLEIATGHSGSLAEWMKSPYAAMFSTMLITAIFYHAFQGIRVIAEDYIKCDTRRIMAILLAKAVFTIATVASVMAIIKLHFA